MLLVLALSEAHVAHAEPTAQASQEARAASAYDLAVDAFDRKEFAVAARHFLEADAVVPSADALSNALVAARLAGDPALLEEAGRRAALRAKTDPELAEQGRRAQEEARSLGEKSVARPTVPAPQPSTASAVPRAGEPSRSRAPAPVEAAPKRTWSPSVFYVGVGATALLTGATVWSGLDALAAKRNLPDTNTQDDNDAVMARAHRTDAFLAGAVLVGAATAYAGLFLVKWPSHDSSVRVGIAGESLVVAGCW